MYNTFLSILSAIMLVWHIFKYKRYTISFPIYIYMCMFPYKLNWFFSYSDSILKIVLILGLILLILRKYKYSEKLRYNIFEVIYFIIVFITGVINTEYKGINSYLFSDAIINLGFMVIFCLYSINEINSKSKFNELCNIFSINGFVLSILTIYEFTIVGVTRPIVTLSNPNYLGLYILIAFIMKVLNPKQNNKVINIIYYLITIYSLMIIKSSTVLICLGLLLIVYSIKNNKIATNTIFLIISIGIVVFTVTYMYIAIKYDPDNIGFISALIKGEDTSRLYIWKYAYEVFINNKFTGIGYGCFRAPVGNYEYVTHNDYLRVIVETGIIGFSIIILLIITSIRRIIKIKDTDIKHLIFVLFMTTLMFSITHNNMNSLLFWFIVSLPRYNIIEESENDQVCI